MESLLKQFGLSEQEIVVFKILLRLGGAKVSDIAKHAGIKRTSCQEVIRSLEEKGFVNYSRIGNKFFYQVEDPDKFRQIISERQFVVDRLTVLLRQQQIESDWEARSLEILEAKKIIKRSKRKDCNITEFGDKSIIGAIVDNKKVLLISTDMDIPAVEIKSKDVAEFHCHILKI